MNQFTGNRRSLRQEADDAPRRRVLTYLPRAALAGDVCTIMAVGLLAAAVRSWSIGTRSQLDTSGGFWLAASLILVTWVALIACLGGYRERMFGVGTDEYRIVSTASFVTAGLTSAACYLASYELSRSFFLVAFVLGSGLLILGRAVLRQALHRARRAGALTHNVIIAGNPANVDDIAAVLRRELWLGYRVLGAVVPVYTADETACGIPVLGTTDQTLGVLEASKADVIFVTDGALSTAERMRELVWDLESRRVQVVVAPGVTDVSRERVRIRPVGGLPLIHLDPPRSVLAGRRLKRTFDSFVTAGLLLAVLPTFVLIALAVKLHDGGPVFFRQVRVGKDGTEFKCLKFRTMVVDAEARLAQLHAEQGFTSGLFKMADDPRITGPGRWLRRFSLDELPQLLNVMRGDMSLVGPRPPLPSEVATYDRFTHRRLHVRPGMTGLWQVSGRSDLSYEEAVRLDLYYVDNWSMLQDISILRRTLGAVTGSRGAY